MTLRNAVGALILGGCTVAAGADYSFEANAGYLYSNNVEQGPQGSSASILAGEVDAAVQHNSRQLLIDAEGAYFYRDVVSGPFDNDSRPELRSLLEWAAIPGHLRLNFEDTYGQVALDPSDGLLPSDYQNINVLSTGPLITLPFTADTKALVAGEYRKVNFADLNADTERTTGRAGVQHDFSVASSANLGVSYARTQYDAGNGQSGSYKISSGFVGLSADSRKAALTAQIGVDRLDTGLSKTSSGILSLSYERSAGTLSHYYLYLNRDISDAAEIFSVDQLTDPGLSDIRNVQATPQPVRHDSARVGYGLIGRRLEARLLLGVEKEHYLALPNVVNVPLGIDRKIYDAALGISYLMSPTLTVGANLNYSKDDSKSADRPDNLIGEGFLRRQVTRRLGWETRIMDIRRSRSVRNFNEIRIYIGVRYIPRSAAARQRILFDRTLERETGRRRDERIDTNAPSDQPKPPMQAPALPTDPG